MSDTLPKLAALSNGFPSEWASPGYESGFYDLLALVRDNPRVYQTPRPLNDLSGAELLPVAELALETVQKADAEARYGGEGADPNAFSVMERRLRLTASMPLLASSLGVPDPSFLLAWEMARRGWQGTGMAVSGTLMTSVQPGSSSLVTDNIADFLSVGDTPFSALLITPGQDTEAVLVRSAIKSDYLLDLQTTPSAAHEAGVTRIVAFPTTGSSAEAAPAFSLLSLRLGRFAPCLVSKLTLDVSLDRGIDVKLDFAAVRLDSGYQVGLRAALPQALPLWPHPRRTPLLISSGLSASIGPVASGTGDFGLPSVVGATLFGGYQGLGTAAPVITGYTITVDNGVEEIYGAPSLSTDDRGRFDENAFPLFLASPHGRRVTGTLKYRSPLRPWQVLQRLAGPSSTNADSNGRGGLYFDIAGVRIVLPEIAWSAAASTGNPDQATEHTLEWTMVAEGDDDLPQLIKP